MAFTMQILQRPARWMGVAVAILACSNQDARTTSAPQQEGRSGGVVLDLLIGSDVLNALDMSIYHGTTPTGPPVVARSIEVSAPNSTVSAFVGALLPGDYTVRLDGTAMPSGTGCHGQDVFTIVAGSTSTRSVTITCGDLHPAPARGNGAVTGD